MEALRLVTEGCHDQVGNLRTSNSATRDYRSSPPEGLDGFRYLSKEVLMTLLWALRTEERKLRSRGVVSGPGSVGISPSDNPFHKFIVPEGEKRGSSVLFRDLSPNTRQRLG